MNNFWEDKNVFITGGSGLLGSNLIKKLLELKTHRLVVLVRDYVPKSLFFSEKLCDKVIIVDGKVEEFHLIERILNEYEIDTIFHLAAQPLVTIANSGPLATFESNIRGTWNVLEACRLHKDRIKRIMIASSDKAYGSQKELPYKETAPLQGEHPYDVSKSCVDLISQSYYKTYGLPIAITRCGNFYGPGDLNFNRIVPETIKNILENKKPPIRSDGTYIRDYIYIPDAVDGYLKIAENLHRDDIKGEAFNISTSNKLNVLELTKLILKIMNSNLEPNILNEANKEIKHQYLDGSKIKRILNWEPKHNIEEGLTKTIEWYKNNV